MDRQLKELYLKKLREHYANLQLFDLKILNYMGQLSRIKSGADQLAAICRELTEVVSPEAYRVEKLLSAHGREPERTIREFIEYSSLTKEKVHVDTPATFCRYLLDDILATLRSAHDIEVYGTINGDEAAYESLLTSVKLDGFRSRLALEIRRISIQGMRDAG